MSNALRVTGGQDLLARARELAARWRFDFDAELFVSLRHFPIAMVAHEIAHGLFFDPESCVLPGSAQISARCLDDPEWGLRSEIAATVATVLFFESLGLPQFRPAALAGHFADPTIRRIAERIGEFFDVAPLATPEASGPDANAVVAHAILRATGATDAVVVTEEIVEATRERASRDQGFARGACLTLALWFEDVGLGTVQV